MQIGKKPQVKGFFSIHSHPISFALERKQKAGRFRCLS